MKMQPGQGSACSILSSLLNNMEKLQRTLSFSLFPQEPLSSCGFSIRFLGLLSLLFELLYTQCIPVPFELGPGHLGK